MQGTSAEQDAQARRGAGGAESAASGVEAAASSHTAETPLSLALKIPSGSLRESTYIPAEQYLDSRNTL